MSEEKQSMTSFDAAMGHLQRELLVLEKRSDLQPAQYNWIAQLKRLIQQVAAGELSQNQWRRQAGLPMFSLEKADVNFDQQGQEIRYQFNIGNLSFSEPLRPKSIAPELLAEAEAGFRQRIKEKFGPDAPYFIPLAATTSEAPAVTADDSCGGRSRSRRRTRPEYCEWITEESTIRKVELPDLGAALSKYPCIILLGDPGCGKTTALQNLAFESADNPRQLPLLLSLSRFVPGMKIEDFIRLGWAGRTSAGHWAAPEPASHLEQYLQGGRLFLLFDALNECPRKAYDQCAGDLRRFIDQWTPSGNRFVVSCRVLDYGEELSGLQRIEIQPFSDVKIRALLEKELPQTWPELWKRLTEADQQERSLLTLARNPYILTMIIDVFDEQGRLGENRAQMLELFTQTLFAWAEKKCEPDQWIDAAIQQEALAHLAFESQDRQGSGAEVPTNLAQAVLPDKVQPDPAWPAIPYPKERVLELTAKAHIVEMPVDRSSMKFYHQLLQEYFAARCLLRRPPQELAEKWCWPWLEQEMPLWHRPEDNYDPLPPPPPTGWEETIILAAGLAPQNDDQLVRTLVEINPVLAGRSLHEGRARVSRDTYQMTIKGLLKTIADPAVALRVRIAAGKVLGYLGDPRIGEMVEIGAGEFFMGDDDDNDASPCHALSLPDYQVGKYPVTNSEFSRFISAKGYEQKKYWSAAGWTILKREEWKSPQYWDDDRFKAPNQPVVGITWFEALAYCRWLSSETGTPYELPSEAQWEKAARGGDGRIYPWGDRFAPESANCKEGKQIVWATTPVGIYPTGISPYGCLDMAGNVWEWTRSLWSRPEFEYPYNPDDGRENIDVEDNFLCVLRGGSWFNFRADARCSRRSRNSPGYGWFDVDGFRVVVSHIISGL